MKIHEKNKLKIDELFNISVAITNVHVSCIVTTTHSLKVSFEVRWTVGSGEK